MMQDSAKLAFGEILLRTDLGARLFSAHAPASSPPITGATGVRSHAKLHSWHAI
jgi:hypothetical protein